jgi:uncharacterized protein YozE (UPF0346 family)
MVELSVIRDLVAIFGVIAGFTYYVMTVRHQNSSRKAQLFMEMYRDFKRPDVQKAFHDIVHVWHWDSFEDFQEKYGRSNWDENNKYMLVYSIYEGLGVLIYRELIDVKMIELLMRSYVTRFWEKIGPIMVEVRTRYDAPLAAEWTEYLYNEVKKIESTPAYLLKSS